MKPARIPLFVRILCWFFVNIAVLAGGIWLILRPDHPPEWFVKQQAEPRLQPVARLLVRELQQRPQEEWDEILAKYDEAHGITFAVFNGPARQAAGVPLDPPDKVRRHLSLRPPGQPEGQPLPPLGTGRRPEGMRPFDAVDPEGPDPVRPGRVPLPNGGAEGRFPQNPPAGNPVGPPLNPPGPGAGGRAGLRQDQVIDIIPEHSEDPPAWWFVIRGPLRLGPGPGTALVLRTDRLSSDWLIGDLTPWLWGAVAVLAVSALLWFPFVRSLTHAVSRMKKATARIAEGSFEVAVPDNRRDELGELAAGIKQMASRLSGFVSGQKRFLGDIAHELCTPLARMQMAGAALEHRVPDELRPRLADLIAEVEEMSALVAELLDFSRAGLAPRSVALTVVELLPAVQQVLAREGVPAERTELLVPPGLTVRSNSGLLCRALGNVVRNALRYAGAQPRLTVEARRDGELVMLTVADDGPGVPPESLPSLFDPFFRIDAARDRASGGTGLGLAIVRTCVESCEGTVTARNRSSGGLEIVFRLPAQRE